MIANDPAREQLAQLLIEIGRTEEELQAMRQTLCQELMFNLGDGMQLFTREETLTAPDLHVQLKAPSSIAAVQSMVRHYNNNQLTGFNKEHFGRIFLTRRNRLLGRLTASRATHGQLGNQAVLVSYVQRIVEREVELHQKISDFRRSHQSCKEELLGIIAGFMKGQCFDMEKLSDFLRHSTAGQIERIVEYFQVSPLKESKGMLTTMRNTLTAANCEEVSSFLSKKTKERHVRSQPKLKSPYVADEFHKLLREPQQIDKMSYREVQSIWRHLNRINSSRRLQLSQKIDEYRRKIQREVKELCVSLKDIIWLEKEIEYARVDLALCADFHPKVFYNSFCLQRNGKLIASSMEEYLGKVGIDNIRTADVYLLFKRFSQSPDGKISCEEFGRIFESAQAEYRQLKKSIKPCPLEDTSNATKIAYVEVLRVTLHNESMIERIRQHLFKRPYFDIRNIFNCMDADEDGFISILDLRVLLQKHLELELSKFDVQLLLRRLGKRSVDDLIGYQEFAYELAPRQTSSRKKNVPTSPK